MSSTSTVAELGKASLLGEEEISFSHSRDPPSERELFFELPELHEARAHEVDAL